MVLVGLPYNHDKKSLDKLSIISQQHWTTETNHTWVLISYILKPLLAELKVQLEHKSRKRIQSSTKVRIKDTHLIFGLTWNYS